MAYEIRFDPEYGKGMIKKSSDQHRTTTLHCTARLFDGEDEIRVWIIDGIPLDQAEGEAYRDARADELFQAFLKETPSVSESVDPDTTKWSATISKAE
jgi:hypothetical protein